MASLSEDAYGRVGKDFVQLVIRDRAPLGMEISRHEDGTATVSRFVEGGQAERMCVDAMLVPDVFHNAAILAVNGVGWSTNNDLCKELNDNCRPKSILFGLGHEDKSMSGISSAVDVQKRYGNFVELVFREGVMGIKVNKAHDFLKVEGFGEKTEASAICKECLLNPKLFEGASILKVNGRTFEDKNRLYEALKSPQRPISVLFEFAADHSRSGPSDVATAMAGPSTPKTETQVLQPLPSRNLSGRRASLKMRKMAVIASKSVRTLAVEQGDHKNDFTLLSDFSESIRQLAIEEEDGDDDRRNGLSRASSKTESMRQLEISIDEMDKLNAMNDQNAMNMSASSALSASSADVEESPRSTRAREILQGFGKLSVRENLKTRFRRRTASGRSVDSDVDSFEDGEREARSLEYMKKEAYEACLDAIRSHLEAFISETPDVSYEEWIEELHPENAQSRRNLVRGRSIDHRFYVEESDHRRLWNENLGGVREFVLVQNYRPSAAPKTAKAFARSPPARKG